MSSNDSRDYLEGIGPEIQQLMTRFQAKPPTGIAVQQLEGLVRTALFKPAKQLVGFLFQQAVDQIDAAYHAKSYEYRQGRQRLQVQGLFGCFDLWRDYHYHAGKNQGHYREPNPFWPCAAFKPVAAWIYSGKTALMPMQLVITRYPLPLDSRILSRTRSLESNAGRIGCGSSVPTIVRICFWK